MEKVAYQIVSRLFWKLGIPILRLFWLTMRQQILAWKWLRKLLELILGLDLSRIR
jgi:hypothetical protein